MIIIVLIVLAFKFFGLFINPIYVWIEELKQRQESQSESISEMANKNNNNNNNNKKTRTSKILDNSEIDNLLNEIENNMPLDINSWNNNNDNNNNEDIYLESDSN